MVAPPPPPPARSARHLPPLPIPHDHWTALARTLNLPPREEHVVELILRGLKDKEIAAEMSLKHSTVRTYCQRIFIRLNVEDRIGLILRLFADSHAKNATDKDHRK